MTAGQISMEILRGCAARCAEAAMPFRGDWSFYLGYALAVWRTKNYRS